MTLRQQVFDPYKTMVHLDEDEHVVVDIRRHPIGLLILYFAAIVAILFFGVVAMYLSPSLESLTGDAYTVLIFGVVGVFFLLCVGLFIATLVYRESRLIVTNKDITQIIQYGLFNRKMSQLSLSNVEDVTSSQDGVLPTYFNYGTLKIETAGEQVNFHFIYCPNPGAVSSAVLEARERFIENYGETSDTQSALFHERKTRKIKKVASDVAEEIVPKPEKIT